MTILVLLLIYIAVVMVILGLLGYDPWKDRRLQRYLDSYRQMPGMRDDIELFLAARIAQTFLTGQGGAELRPTMRIAELYDIMNLNSTFDDLEYEHLILQVQHAYKLTLTQDEVTSPETIRALADLIRNRLALRSQDLTYLEVDPTVHL